MSSKTVESQQQCYVFVDNSNTWILGQKALAKKNQLKDSVYDLRFRMDYGELLGLLSKGRGIAKAKLYGSRPPPNDHIWKVAEQHGFTPEIFDRSTSGQEKGVDVAMGCGITRTLDKDIDSNKENKVLILATGDYDFIAPINDALKEQVHVELWSCGGGMAAKYKNLAKKNSLLTVHYLEDFGYEDHKSTREKINKACAIVLKDIPKDEPSQKQLYEYIDQQLRRLFFTTVIEDGDKKHLVAEFPYTPQETVIEELEALPNLKHEVCTYDTYLKTKRRKKPPKPKPTYTVPTGNPFASLSTEEEAP